MGLTNLSGGGGSGGSNVPDLTNNVPPDTLYATNTLWGTVKGALDRYRTIYLTTDRYTPYDFDGLVINSELTIHSLYSPFSHYHTAASTNEATVTISERVIFNLVSFKDFVFIGNSAGLDFNTCFFQSVDFTGTSNRVSFNHCRIAGAITSSLPSSIILNHVLIDELVNLPDPLIIEEHSLVTIRENNTTYTLLNGAWEILGVSALNSLRYFSSVSPVRLVLSLIANRTIDGGIIT